MTVAQMRDIADRYGAIQTALRNLEQARDGLDKLVRFGRESPTIKVGYNEDGSTRNDYYTKHMTIPVAIPIQHAIYECAAIERRIVLLGGTVPPDPRPITRHLNRNKR